LALKVPQVNQTGALAPAPEKRVINVHRDGRISFDRDFVTLEQLGARLTAARQQYAGLGVVVRGDAEGAFQHVATVLGACREAGITDMGISVRLAQRDQTAGH
jgi:biopolymer transport protein ExbD